MAKTYLDEFGLSAVWTKIKEKFVTDVSYDATDKIIQKTRNGETSNVVSIATLKSDMGLLNVEDGAEVNQNAFSNVKVGSTTVEADTETDTLELAAGTNITLTPDATNDKITIGTSAEVNQNAFSNVKVGSTTVAADSKTDTLELAAGDNITLTPDATNDKVTITGSYPEMAESDIIDNASPDITTAKVITPYVLDQIIANKKSSVAEKLSPGATIDGMLFTGLASEKVIHYGTCSTAAGTAAKTMTITTGVPASTTSKDGVNIFSLGTGAVIYVKFTNTNTVTSQVTLNVNSTSNAPIKYKGANFTDLVAGIIYCLVFDGTNWEVINVGTTYSSLAAASGGTAVSLVTTGEKYTWNNKANSASPALTGTPTAPTATAGTSTTQIATTAFVTTAVSNAIASATAGVATFQGTVTQYSTISGSAYKNGWYWVIQSAGTYAGQACEVGDMIFAIADKGSTASDGDFAIVQYNIAPIDENTINTICV